jgi:hypothetical protein
MKKLKLTLDDLEVTSFAARDEPKGTGTVNGMQETGFTCLCSDAFGCQQTIYCTGYAGEPNVTCYDACMTNQNGAC